MHLGFAEIILWYCSIALECTLCVLVFSRRIYRYLPVFAAYAVLLVARAGLIRWVYAYFGYGSGVAVYSFWTTEAVLVLARGLAVGELAWTASRLYPGFRVVLKWSLSTLAGVLLVATAIVAFTNVRGLQPLILGLERELNFGSAVALLALFAFSSWYGAVLDLPRKFVALGFFVYSVLQVPTNAIPIHWVTSYLDYWNVLRIASFQIAEVLWVFALVKWERASSTASVRASDIEALRELVQEGNRLMSDLYGRISSLRKVRKA